MIELDFESNRDNRHIFHSLPIGTHTDIINFRSGGYNRSTKVEIVKLEIKRLFSLNPHLNESLQKIAVVDEAQSGSTSSTLVSILLDLYPKATIAYIPCKDVKTPNKQSIDRYKKLIDNSTQNVIGYTVPIILFYIDRTSLLPLLVIPTAVDEEHAPYNPALMIMKIENIGARNFFRFITLLVVYKYLVVYLLNTSKPRDSLNEYELKYLNELENYIQSLESSGINHFRTEVLRTLAKSLEN